MWRRWEGGREAAAAETRAASVSTEAGSGQWDPFLKKGLPMPMASLGNLA